MDFGTWSPSHTILVLVVVVAFVGQIAVLFYRTGQLEKRMDKQNNELRRQGEHLENRIDKRIDEVRAEISDLRSELRSEIRDVRSEIANLRTDVQSEINDVRTEISKLNQNHIEHLGYHNHGE